MNPNPDAEKVERLVIMAERLIEALQGDIAALEAGKPLEMRSLDPEVERLTMMYIREATNLDPARIKTVTLDLRQRLAAATGKFREILNLHTRLLTRMKNASEGLIKAVADEVQRQRAPTVTYTPATARYRPAGQAPMIFNNVI